MGGHCALLFAMGQSEISVCWCKLIETPEPARPSRLDRVGTWLSLVEHSLGVRGVGSSNLPVPTIHFLSHLRSPFQSDGPTGEAPQFAFARECASPACEGARQSRVKGSSNLPVPTI